MSEMEHVKGTLTPMNGTGNIEDQCEAVCKEHGWVPYEGDTWLNTVYEYGYDLYHVRGNQMYRVDARYVDPYGFAEAELQEDGTIKFDIMWYNGGAGRGEVIDDALKALEAKA